MNRFYQVYQFVVPALLFPFAYWLWLDRFDGNHAVTSLVMFVPVVAYYVLVIFGIAYLRLWQMNTRPTIRGLRPHHGFVIGTATGLIAYVCVRLIPVASGGLAGVLTVAFIVGSVFAFWNWWYETYAIKSGFISIYTKLAADGASAEESVTDYAPILFGSLGFVHGAMVKSAENLLLPVSDAGTYWTVAFAGGAALIVVPSLCYSIAHWVRYRESGFRSYKSEIDGQRDVGVPND